MTKAVQISQQDMPIKISTDSQYYPRNDRLCLEEKGAQLFKAFNNSYKFN
jgi:hypothetical protein